MRHGGDGNRDRRAGYPPPPAALSARRKARQRRTRPAGIDRSPARNRPSDRPLPGPGDKPQDAPGPIDRRKGEGHPPPTLVKAADGDVRVENLKCRVPREEGGRVAVLSQPELDEVENRRGSRDPAKLRFVAARPRVEILPFHRHRVDVGGGDGDAIDQGFLQVGIVAFGISGRCDPFIDLEQVDVLPGDLFPGKSAKGQPRRRAAADRQRAPAPRRHRFPRDLCDPLRGPGCDGPRVRKNLGFQRFSGDPGDGAGSYHRSGASNASASCGPQVPGSYGKTGDSAFNTGSTILHASST